MELLERIKLYIAKRSKTAQILELMMHKKYVTCSDIINYQCENQPIVFTTSPHSIIENIRNAFGVDFVKDEDVKFEAVRYYNGKPYTVSDTYKRYFINFEGVR